MPDSETQHFIVDASWEEVQAVKTSPSKRFEAPEHSHSIFKLAANVGNLSLNVFEKIVGKPLADNIASVSTWILFGSPYFVESRRNDLGCYGNPIKSDRVFEGYNWYLFIINFYSDSLSPSP